MKKRLYLPVLALLLLWLAGPAKAEDKPAQRKGKKEPKGNQIENTLIGFSGGRYFVASDRFKKIYGKYEAMYGAELTRILFGGEHHNLALSLEANYFYQRGSSTFTREKTQIYLLPLSLSARYLFQWGDFIPFVGAGYDYFMYEERSELHHTKDYTHGYHAQAGLYFQIPWARFIKINIYAKYTQAFTEENGIKVDLGGLEAAGGLTFGFNLL